MEVKRHVATHLTQNKFLYERTWNTVLTFAPTSIK